eukprot:5070297-Prymnesium_polylepis.2
MRASQPDLLPLSKAAPIAAEQTRALRGTSSSEEDRCKFHGCYVDAPRSHPHGNTIELTGAALPRTEQTEFTWGQVGCLPLVLIGVVHVRAGALFSAILVAYDASR